MAKKLFTTIVMILIFIFYMACSAQAAEEVMEKLQNKFLVETNLGYNNLITFKENDIYAEVIPQTGDAIIRQNDEINDVNIHVPLNYDGEFLLQPEGAYILEGNVITRYYAGQPVEEIVLTDEIPIVKKIIKYYNEFWVILANDKNIYTIDSAGKVYKITENLDVRQVVLTNYLEIPDIQISIITEENKYYYTTEIFEGEWCGKQEGVIGFQEDGVIKE